MFEMNFLSPKSTLEANKYEERAITCYQSTLESPCGLIISQHLQTVYMANLSGSTIRVQLYMYCKVVQYCNITTSQVHVPKAMTTGSDVLTIRPLCLPLGIQ